VQVIVKSILKQDKMQVGGQEKDTPGKTNRFSHSWMGVVPFCHFHEMGAFTTVND
jgi:hypothetical protein